MQGRTLLCPGFFRPHHEEVTILVGAASWGDSISALRVGHPRGGEDLDLVEVAHDEVEIVKDLVVGLHVSLEHDKTLGFFS